MRINDKLNQKAKEKFGAQNPDKFLRKAILMAITHIGHPKSVVVDWEGNLDVTLIDYDARGKIMVVQVEFDDDAVRDYIQKAALGNGFLLRYETICPESYLRFQNAVVESLNNIAENWF